MKKGNKFKTVWKDIKDEIFIVDHFACNAGKFDNLKDVPKHITTIYVEIDPAGSVLLKNVIWI